MIGSERLVSTQLFHLRKQVPVHNRRDGRIIEWVVRPALKLADRQVVLLHILVHRRWVLACLLQVSAHVEERIGRVPVPNDPGGVHVAEQTCLHDVPHVHDHVRVLFVLFVEHCEGREQLGVGRVGHRYVLHLRQNILPNPPVGHFRVRQPPNKAGNLFATLVIDERADRKRPAPQTVGLRIKREYFFHNRTEDFHLLSRLLRRNRASEIISLEIHNTSCKLHKKEKLLTKSFSCNPATIYP